MAKIRLHLDVSTSIFLMSVLTGAVVFVAFIISSVSIFNSIFDKLYQEKALAITNSINAVMGIDDIRDSEKLLNIIQKYIFLNPDIYQLSVSVPDEDNQLVVKASNIDSLVGLRADSENDQSFVSEVVVQKKVLLNDGESGLRVVVPIISGGQKVGTYELYLSTQLALVEFRNKMVVFLALISVFVFLVSLMFYYMARRKVIVPINKIVFGVDQIGGGNMDYRIQVESDDEIGKLAVAFNDSTSKLADLYTGLEQRVKEKTEELSKKLVEFEELNLTLKENSKAMVNILEDEKELESELESEKKGVEKKVEERTRELSETKARLDSSIENLPLGFLMVDIEEKVVVTNSLANKILEGKDEKSNLNNLKKVLKEKIDLGKYIKNCGKEKKNFIYSDIEINGRYFQFLLSPILTKETEEQCVGIVVLIQDITEAKILDRSKDEFFSIASHELRTPLTAIRGNTSMILEYYASALKDPELKAMVDDIHESSIRLINIVNDFLNVSRLEQSRMEFNIKEFDVGGLIPETIKEYNVTGSRKKIGIDYLEASDPLPLVSGDSDKVRQILINLLGNALKFTSEGNIKISTEVSDGFVKVLVSDTGRGIPLKQQSLLFHKFQQTGESLFTRDTAGGSGLGLYISKMMIEGMGGEIKLEKSKEGKGSTFSFTLPVAKK